MTAPSELSEMLRRQMRRYGYTVQDLSHLSMLSPYLVRRMLATGGHPAVLGLLRLLTALNLEIVERKEPISCHVNYWWRTKRLGRSRRSSTACPDGQASPQTSGGSDQPEPAAPSVDTPLSLMREYLETLRSATGA